MAQVESQEGTGRGFPEVEEGSLCGYQVLYACPVPRASVLICLMTSLIASEKGTRTPCSEVRREEAVCPQ